MSGRDRELHRQGLLLALGALVVGIGIGSVFTIALSDRGSEDVAAAAIEGSASSEGLNDSDGEVVEDPPETAEARTLETTSVAPEAATTTTTTTTTSTTVAPPMGLASRADIPIGAAVPGGIGFGANILDRPDLQALVVENFSEITAENIMKPLYTHPEQGVFDFAATDELVSWAESQGIAVHGHTLLWDAFTNSQTPLWMQNFQGSPDEWREWTDAYVQEVVSRYRGRIRSWDVVNEALNDDGSIRDTFWQRGIGDSYIEEAFLAADRADPDALLYYNDFRFTVIPEKLDGAIALVEDFKARDIPIDGLGFQMHILADFPDPENIREAFSKAADTGLLVKLTELDVRVNNQQEVLTALDDAAAQRQAERYRTVVDLYFQEIPPEQRGGITVWGISDPESYLSTGPDWPLLFDGALQEKPAYSAFEAALNAEFGTG